jgi:hypothetical protein
MPAPDRRHGRRERRRCSRPCKPPYDHRPTSHEVTRNTAETKITVRVNLDGTGQAKLATGIGFFDHMLDQIARHGLIDLDIAGQGDLHIDGHHTVEDVGITLGQAVLQGGRRQEGHPPLRPRLRAAGRGAVARSDRLLRPPGLGDERAVPRAA